MQKRTIYVFVCFFFCALFLFFHASYYLPFLSDDALISLRYADRLLQGKGLTWTDGKPVEGYSNLLWVLCVAALGKCGVDLIDAARWLGFLCLVGVMASLGGWFLFSKRTSERVFPLFVGMLFFCMAAPVAVWSVGGLEQPLVALLIGLSIPMLLQIIHAEKGGTLALLVLSFVLGCLCLTRPDGPLFVIAALLALGIMRWQTGALRAFWAEAAWISLFPVLFYGGQLLFRLSFYGEWVPNTALVKISPSLHRVMQGARYVAFGMLALAPFSLLSLWWIGRFVLSATRRPLGLVLLGMGGMWGGYVILIGGDIFPAYRHFLPLVVIFAFAVVEGVDLLLERYDLSSFLYKKVFAFLIILFSFYLYFLLQILNDEAQGAIAERWEWDGKVIGLLLKKTFSAQQPLVAVTAAGCIPYWSGLPALDMLGLNDHYLPRHRPKDFGVGPLGHELGDGKYVLRRNPDIIVFHTGQKTDSFRGGREMQAMEVFYQRYAPIVVQGNDPHPHTFTMWIRKKSPKIGIKSSPSKIVIPGFLFHDIPGTTAFVGKQDRLVVAVSAGRSVRFSVEGFALSAGWRVEVKASKHRAVWGEIKQRGAAWGVTLRTKETGLVEIEEVILKKPM